MKSSTDHDNSPRLDAGTITRATPAALGTTMRARFKPLLVALGVAMVLIACDTILPPPVGTSYQRLLGTSAIWGVQVTVAYAPDEFEFTGFSGAKAGVIARVYDDDDGNLVIGLVATSAAMSGELLRLTWDGPEGADPPQLTATAAFDAARANVDNAVSLSDLTPADSSVGQTYMVSTPTLSGGEASQAGSTSEPAFDSLALQASFADFRLGDVDKSGTVDVLDALLVWDVVAGANADPDDFALYHSDLSGEGQLSIDDVEMTLAKAIDPTVPAHLVVKPNRLTFVELQADKPVLVGNGGSEALTGLAFSGDNFTGTTFAGTSSQPVPGHSAVYTVNDPKSAIGELTVSSGSQTSSVDVGNIVFVVAGQSNASGWGAPMIPELQDSADYPEVRALGNDYVWKPAVEALDNGMGQLDMISFDSINLVSAGVQLGRLLNSGDDAVGIEATDRYVYLIPAGRGASRLTPRTSGPDTGSGWRISEADLAGTDRDTLFGSAAYRGLVSSGDRPIPAEAAPSEHDAEGGPVSAVYWFQGESDSSEGTYRANFAPYSNDVFTAFENQFQTAAGKPIIIYAQLAPYGYDSSIDPSTDAALGEDLRQMDIAERQRRMEEGAYAGAGILNPSATAINPRANTHMVVTNDLPRSDRIHLGSDAQMVVAERVALAYQEHYLGLDVDGTGPRVQSLTRSGNVVTVTFDREVTNTTSPGANGYSGYFSAWNGTPNPSNLSSSYGTSNQVAVTDARRHPSNPRAVQVTLASSPATIYLRYMRPHEDTLDSDYVQDVVRSAESGLPLPSFGPLKVN